MKNTKLEESFERAIKESLERFKKDRTKFENFIFGKPSYSERELILMKWAYSQGALDYAYILHPEIKEKIEGKHND